MVLAKYTATPRIQKHAVTAVQRIMAVDALTVTQVFMFAERGDQTVSTADLPTKETDVPIAQPVFTTISEHNYEPNKNTKNTLEK